MGSFLKIKEIDIKNTFCLRGSSERFLSMLVPTVKITDEKDMNINEDMLTRISVYAYLFECFEH